MAEGLKHQLLHRLLYYQKVFIFKWNTAYDKKCLMVPKGIQLTAAGVKDIFGLHSRPDFDLKDYSWSTLSQKFSQGLWHGLLAKADDEVVGYVFYTKHEMVFAGSKVLALDLPPHSCYFFRIFVHPTARNTGVGKVLLDKLLELCCQEGLSEAYAAVNSTNLASIKTCRSLSGKIVGSVFFFKTRFFDWAICSPGLLLTGLKSNASKTADNGNEILPY